MSFIGNKAMGQTYAPGWFLANNEDCTRLTQQMKTDGSYVKEANGGKYVPMGTVYPANGSTAIGIVYEDVDVTNGDMPGSVVVSGTVYKNRLPVAINEAAVTALEGKGFVFLDKPEVIRP